MLGIVTELTRAKVVRLNESIVTLGPPDTIKNAVFNVESGTMGPETLKVPTGSPVVGSTACPLSE